MCQELLQAGAFVDNILRGFTSSPGLQSKQLETDQ